MAAQTAPGNTILATQTTYAIVSQMIHCPVTSHTCGYLAADLEVGFIFTFAVSFSYEVQGFYAVTPVHVRA